MKKLLSILMSVLIVSTCFMTGCSDEKEHNHEHAAQVTFNENVAAVAGDVEITMDELAVYVATVTSQLQQYTGNQPGWEDIVGSNGLTAHDTIIEYAVEEAWYQNALYAMCLEEGIFAKEDEDAKFAEFIETCGGEEVFREMLDETGFTEEGFKKYVSINAAYEALVNSLCSEEDAQSMYNDVYITAKHILVTFEGRESEDAALEEINAIYERVLAGENFESLIDELGEDPGQDSATGYTFADGEMVDEFYNGALDLKVGEVSEPIKTSYGYHIIKRYDNPGSEDANYQSYIANVQNIVLGEYFTEEKTNELLERYPISKNEDLLKTIDLSKYTAEEVTTEDIAE